MDKGTNKIDIFYSAFNRLEFVKITLDALIKHTNWDYVNLLYVVDDGSTDGTYQYLAQKVPHITDYLIFVKCPKKEKANLDLVAKEFNNFLEFSESDYVSRIDSDAAVPKEWVERFLEVMDKYSNLYFATNLYGFRFQKNRLIKKNHIGFYEVNAVGGVGVFRREAFIKLGFPEIEERFLFNFQLKAKNYGMKSGFIYPPNEQIVILDWLKEFEELSNIYIKKGWAREHNIRKLLAPNWFKEFLNASTNFRD